MSHRSTSQVYIVAGGVAGNGDMVAHVLRRSGPNTIVVSQKEEHASEAVEDWKPVEIQINCNGFSAI